MDTPSKSQKVWDFTPLNLSKNPEQMNLFLYSGEKTRYFHLPWKRLGGIWMNDAKRRKRGIVNFLRKWILKETPNIRNHKLLCFLIHDLHLPSLAWGEWNCHSDEGGLLPCQASTKVRCFIMTDLRGMAYISELHFLKCSWLPTALNKFLSSLSPTPFLQFLKAEGLHGIR